MLSAKAPAYGRLGRRTVTRTAHGPVGAVSIADTHRDGKPDVVLGGPVTDFASSAVGRNV